MKISIAAVEYKRGGNVAKARIKAKAIFGSFAKEHKARLSKLEFVGTALNGSSTKYIFRGVFYTSLNK